MRIRPTSGIFVLLSLMAVLNSCAPKVWFSEEARTKLEEAGIDVTKIQFYNDKEIILRRKADSEDVKADAGKIVEIDGRRIQEVRIGRGTPGIVDSVVNGKLVVRFELGEGRQLRFYKNSHNKFQIDADRWIQGKGVVTYGTREFFVERVGNDALLMVKKTKKYKSLTESKRAKGVTIKK